MSEDIKNYHVETQEDYDNLMVELEQRGYRWRSGDLPTDEEDFWTDYEGNTCVQTHEYDKSLTYGSVRNVGCGEIVIKHKAKGVKQMEKVVVPQIVADWFEEHKSISLYKTLNRYLNNVGMSCELRQWQDSFGKSFKENLNEVEESIAKMHLYGYEVEEKKYHWRKKKEYLYDFEDGDYIYLNIEKDTGEVYFSSKKNFDNFQTILTEKEVKQAVGINDFNKLERVEIDG